jgi:uncharacterized protein YjdB
MKRIKFLGIMMLGMSCLFQSCNKDEVQPNLEKPNSQSGDYFFVKNSSGDVVSDFDPNLLALIKKDLEQKNRIKDAEKLTQSYDMKTGKLFSQFKDEAQAVSKSSRISSGNQNFELSVCVQHWIADYITGVYIGATGGFPGVGTLSWLEGGTTGQSRAMLGFKIKSYLATGYGLQYCVHRGNVGWESYKDDDQFTNITNSSQEVQAFRVRVVRTNFFSPNKYYGVFYQAHVSNHPDEGYGDGWMGWTGNDAVAGTTGQSRMCQAMRVGIYEY